MLESAGGVIGGVFVVMICRVVSASLWTSWNMCLSADYSIYVSSDRISIQL